MVLAPQLLRMLLNKRAEGIAAGLCCDVPRRTARGDVARGSYRRRIADVRYMRDRAARGGNTLIDSLKALRGLLCCLLLVVRT